VALEVVTPVVTIDLPAGDVAAGTSVELGVRAPVGLVPHLRASLAGGPPTPVAAGGSGRGRATVEVPADARGQLSVEVTLEIDGTTLTLAQAVLGVRAEAPPPPPPREPLWTLGLFATLSGEATGAVAAPSGAASVGMRLGRELGDGGLTGELALGAGSRYFAEGSAQKDQLAFEGHAGLTWSPARGPARPFLAAGLGVAILPDESEIDPIGYLGVGGVYRLARHAGLRLDLRATFSRTSDDGLVAAQAQLAGFLAF
jgi:hypothetical protein